MGERERERDLLRPLLLRFVNLVRHTHTHTCTHTHTHIHTTHKRLKVVFDKTDLSLSVYTDVPAWRLSTSNTHKLYTHVYIVHTHKYIQVSITCQAAICIHTTYVYIPHMYIYHVCMYATYVYILHMYIYYVSIYTTHVYISHMHIYQRGV